MMQALMVLWVANRKVYGAHKLWKAARRAGHDIGRDQVARLMRELGIHGVTRRRKVFTTRPDPDAVRAPDLVKRNFTAERPDALWVTDLTYVPTRSGMAYVCFIVDAFSRRIVGWRVAANMRTEMVLDALEMARRSRGGRRLVGLVAHSDAGIAVHVGAVHRTARRDRRPPFDRHRRRQLRQRARPRRPTGSTRPSASTGPTHAAGTTSTTSNWPRCRGCTGSTSDRLHGHCDDVAAGRVRSSVLRCSTDRPRQGLETNSPSLHQTQGGSRLPGDRPRRRQRCARIAPSRHRLSIPSRRCRHAHLLAIEARRAVQPPRAPRTGRHLVRHRGANGSAPGGGALHHPRTSEPDDRLSGRRAADATR